MTETVGNEMQRPARSRLGALARRWPTALGLAAAASSGYELVGGMTAEGVEQALLIAVPVLVYLTAAVFGMLTFDIEPVLGLAAASGVAEFCAVLDLLVGTAVIVLTVATMS